MYLNNLLKTGFTMKCLAILLTLLLTACTSPETAYKALDDMGMKEINTGNLSIFGCAQDDFIGRKFTAKNQNGKAINGIVCNQFFKGATIRFY